MLKDKLLIRFYIFLIILFLSLYYVGESRDRKFRELGFKICAVNGLEMWTKKCPEEENIFSKSWSR
nr:MAG: hypothetical protein [Caudoviricetes sp.]